MPIGKPKSSKAKSLRAARGGSRSRKPLTALSDGSVIYRSPDPVAPASIDIWLSYHVQNVVTNVAGTQASIRFRTEAYDVDPALGSTAMPGFAEWATIYARYRPLAMGYKFSVANQEAFPLTVIHGFSNSSIASGSVAITYAGNPFMQSTMVGPATGKGISVLQGMKTIQQLAGTKQALFDDLYTGSTSSATLSSTGTKYCYCAVIAPQALTALGLLVTVEVKLKLRFFLRNWLLS